MYNLWNSWKNKTKQKTFQMSGYLGEICGSVWDMFEINCFLSFFSDCSLWGNITRQISTKQIIWYKKKHLYSMTINLASPASSCQSTFLLSSTGLNYCVSETAKSIRSFAQNIPTQIILSDNTPPNPKFFV